MRPFYSCFTFLLISSLTTAQTTVVFQPDSIDGKDAMIWYITSQTTSHGPTNTTNYGSFHSIISHEWTWNSSVGHRRSLLEFDLNSIAPAQILDAKLSLYHNPTSGDPLHSQTSGSNECYLERIIAPWQEHSVTWDTQPTTTSSNAIILPASLNDFQDYLDIDVTTLVQDMVDDTANSHGFMLRMVTEQHYRGLVFGSSDHLSISRHPKLEVTYNRTVGINGSGSILNVSVYPNPAENTVRLTWSEAGNTLISLRDAQGRVLHSDQVLGNDHVLDVSRISSGCYTVRIEANDEVAFKRLIVE